MVYVLAWRPGFADPLGRIHSFPTRLPGQQVTNLILEFLVIWILLTALDKYIQRLRPEYVVKFLLIYLLKVSADPGARGKDGKKQSPGPLLEVCTISIGRIGARGNAQHGDRERGNVQNGIAQYLNRESDETGLVISSPEAILTVGIALSGRSYFSGIMISSMG